MNQKDLYMLLYLARKTALDTGLQTSTGKIAIELGLSQQTVSRKLTDFAAVGMIQYTVTRTGVEIRVSQQGRKHLYALYDDLQQLFAKKQELCGVVKDGLGEGRFYMEQEGYKKQFVSLLGFMPYPGTLNLAVDPIAVENFIATRDPIMVSGFLTKKRSFGGLICYTVQVQGKLCALILPDRSVHKKDTVELIAAEFLRETLQLENGKNIIIE
jgi:riboflavin kinase, archaea type